MDTRFWGPGAWKLLHTITYHSEAPLEDIREFLSILPYVLPCKFCRASLTDYYEKEPLTFTNRRELQHWMYRVHNHVNGKLRKQGFVTIRNPTYDAVEKMYSGACAECSAFPAWDFLYSIAYNHPLKVKSTPMPGAPAADVAANAAEANRWNILSPRARLTYWCKFWDILPRILPAEWKDAWVSATAGSPCELEGRRDSVAWIWNIRCKFDTTRRDPYREVCSRLVSHSSGCSKSRRARTCRKKR